MKKLHLILIMLFIGLQINFAQTDNGTTEPAKQAVATQKIKVFPNPATIVVNVLGLQNSNRAEILISDLYGTVVQKHNWEIKNNALSIPISNLESGIFMISIRSQEQTVQTKFIKK